jgi:hypothetical protein
MPEPTTTAEPVAPRQCGRCRQSFPGDPTLHPVAQAEWWTCPTCHDALFSSKTPRS